MGIDTQKGQPVVKQPVELTTFLVKPWYERYTRQGDVEVPGRRDGTMIPAIVETQCEPGQRLPAPDTKVFIVSDGPSTARILVCDPAAREVVLRWRRCRGAACLAL